MNFIQLTAKETGVKVLINLDMVFDIVPTSDGNGTNIAFGGNKGGWTVSEPIEEIELRIPFIRVTIPEKD